MRNIYILVFLSFFSFSLHAQLQRDARHISFDQLSLEDGLSQSTVLCVWQDKFGFMWFGTRDGLNRYDGYNFKTYRKSQNATFSQSLAGNVIHDLAEDSDGNLWVATDLGLSKFDRLKEEFTSYQISDSLGDDKEIDALEIGSDGKIWIGSYYGLLIFEPLTGEFIPFYKLMKNQKDILDNAVHAIHEGEGNHIWVGTSNGAYSLNMTNKSIVLPKMSNGKSLLISARVESIEHDQSGKVYVGTYGEGLFMLDSQGSLIKRIHSEDEDLRISLTNNNIRSLKIDDSGDLWIGTFDGLNILNKEHSQIQRITYQEGNQSGLSHNSIRSLYKDNKGSIWIGTYFGGVNIFDVDNQRFAFYTNIPGDTSSLSYNVVGAFTESANRLYVGTERGGINVYSPETDTHSEHKFSPDNTLSISGNTIKSLYTDSKGRVWAGIFRGGLNKLIHDGRRAERMPVARDSSFYNQMIVNNITEDTNGHLWIASDRFGGVHKFCPDSQEYMDFLGSEELKTIIDKAPVKHIFIDKEGILWLSTRGQGLILFDPQTGHSKRWSTLNHELESLAITEVNHVRQDASGNLWISTNGWGVIQQDRSGNKYRRHHSGNGLLNDIAFGSLEDKQGNIWIITVNGITQVFNKKVNLEFKNYTHSSGFPIQEINEGAFFIQSSGEFLIGGSNGYTRFDPATLQNNNYIPPLIFTDLKISNQPVVPGPTEVLSKPLYLSEEITLTYFQSVVTLDFAALSFIRPENNQYAYKLEGFDEDWNFIGNRRSVTFTNLPDKVYFLKIKGSNNDGLWNEKATVLKINVLPPPWKTWWAFIIYGVLIILGFLTIRNNALRSAQLKHDLRFEQLEKDKLKEIHQLKLQYFTDVSHEFRTPLTLITSPLEEIIESGKGGRWLRKKFKMMYFNSKRLLLLIDQILEIRELETGHSKLKLSPVILEDVIRGIVDSFKELADKKKIKLVFISGGYPETYLMDIDKIEKIFFNLLSNAFKFTPPGGEIIVNITRQRLTGDSRSWFHFSIEDTGIGIDEENQQKIFDRFFYQENEGSGAGIGLSLTKSLVELLGGSVSVASRLNEGTKFTVKLPFDPISSSLESNTEYTFTVPLPMEYQKKEEEEELDVEENKKPTLLLVEDNLELSNYLREQLHKKYKIVVKSNGVDGLNYIKEYGPDLVICDIMMPEMNGLELCEYIKNDELLSHIPIILLTAKSSHIDRLEGLKFGADDYISKPFIMTEVRSRIENILRNRQRLQEKFKSASYLPDTSVFNSHDEKFLRKIVEVIESHLDEPTLTVEFLSNEVGFSRVQLFRKLKTLSGLSPGDFIKDFRLKKAATLLQTGRFKISEVAYMVGFQDVQYFGKCFKKAFKKTPTDFISEQQTVKAINHQPGNT